MDTVINSMEHTSLNEPAAEARTEAMQTAAEALTEVMQTAEEAQAEAVQTIAEAQTDAMRTVAEAQTEAMQPSTEFQTGVVQSTSDAQQLTEPMQKIKRTKVSNAVRRARQNAKLRRRLKPKNSIKFLEELRNSRGSVKFHVVQVFKNGPFRAIANIDGEQYYGQAQTKAEAKEMAAENALKTILTDQMRDSANAAGDVSDSVDNDAAPEHGEDEGGTKKKRRVEEDLLPWGGLASFALHKLFAEWNWKIGSDSRLSTKKTGPRRPTKRMRADANKKHPVMLLNELIPNLTYREERIPQYFCEECYDEVAKGDQLTGAAFKVFVNVHGKTYEGAGRNLKEAKIEAAKAVISAEFGVV